MFDSIICDPPYGVRAKVQKVVTNQINDEKFKMSQDNKSSSDDSD